MSEAAPVEVRNNNIDDGYELKASAKRTVDDKDDGGEETSRPDPQLKKSKKNKATKGDSNKAPKFNKFDVNVDERERKPSEGSFANPELRELFGVDLNLDKIDMAGKKTAKRKVCLLLGFLGTKYCGFQHNVNQRTIQAEVELALYKAGLIADANFGYPFKEGFSMSARTDKGVHACAQVISLKVELLESELDDMEAIRQKIQARLPSDIQVLDLLRTTRKFCSRTQRDRVRYQYMIPSFLLHPDYRGLMTSHGISVEGRRESAKEPLSRDEILKLQSVLKEFRSTPEQREKLQDALKKYEGTHPFHNFTKGLKPGAAQANRFIETFRLQDPIIVNGVEWIPSQVLGQSFLLHQIRKMVCMAIDVARGTASPELMDKALSKKEIVRLALAPAQGLFLEMSYFGGYNKRKAQQVEYPDLDWTVDGPVKERWEAFRNVIREHIIQEEEEQGNFIQYMYQQECIFEHERFYSMDYDVASETAQDEERAAKREEET